MTAPTTPTTGWQSPGAKLWRSVTRSGVAVGERLVLALMLTRLGRVPPYVSLDNSTWCLNAPSSWSVSRWGAFTCRTRALGDDPEDDERVLHVANGTIARGALVSRIQPTA